VIISSLADVNFSVNSSSRYLPLGESIKTANEQITECKKELEEAKTIRKNRQGRVMKALENEVNMIAGRGVAVTIHAVRLSKI
jgi:hypothetical protein